MTTTKTIIDFDKDPLGLAIFEYSQNKKKDKIIVHSDLCDDDIMPINYLFRDYNMMPEIEKLALKLCHGRILDVGAGAGCHSKYLKDNNFDVLAIDTSKGSIDYLKSQNIVAQQVPFLALNYQKFDTILILMNGLGLAGRLNKMSEFLSHAKSLLNEGGKIIADSSDLKYLFEDEEGGYWMDLNAEYYGEMQFQMEYKNIKSDWFDWIYIDFETLKKEAEKVGLKAEKLFENENFQYLASLEAII